MFPNSLTFINLTYQILHVDQTLKFQNVHVENENYMNLLQPIKCPPLFTIKFLGILLPFPLACTLYKGQNMATANKSINENVVAVEDLKI